MIRGRGWPRALLSALAGISLILFYLAGQHFSPAAALAKKSAESVRKEALPRAGKQLVMVYIGSSRCNPSNQSDVIASISIAMDSLREAARRQSIGYVTIGVAREQSPVAGLSHLEKVGRFDELAVGQGDLNQASIRFISVDHPGIGATPQLIVLQRELRPHGQTIDNVQIVERVLTRRVGAAEIRRWVERGTPLPRSWHDTQTGESQE